MGLCNLVFPEEGLHLKTWEKRNPVEIVSCRQLLGFASVGKMFGEGFSKDAIGGEISASSLSLGRTTEIQEGVVNL